MAQRLLHARHDERHALPLCRHADPLHPDPPPAPTRSQRSCGAGHGHRAGSAVRHHPFPIVRPCQRTHRRPPARRLGLKVRPIAGSAGFSESPTCGRPLTAARSWVFNRRCCPVWRCCVPTGAPVMRSCPKPRQRVHPVHEPGCGTSTPQAVGVLASSTRQSLPMHLSVQTSHQLSI